MKPDVTVSFRPVPGYPGYVIGEDRSVWSSLEADGAGAASAWSLIGFTSCTPGKGWNWVRPDVRPGRGAEVVLMPPATRRRIRVSVDRLMARVWPTDPAAIAAAEDDAAPTTAMRRDDDDPRRPKLSARKVAEMRRLKAEGFGYPYLMARFGVSRSTVFYALTGATWRHVLPEDEGPVGCPS